MNAVASIHNLSEVKNAIELARAGSVSQLIQAMQELARSEAHLCNGPVSEAWEALGQECARCAKPRFKMNDPFAEDTQYIEGDDIELMIAQAQDLARELSLRGIDEHFNDLYISDRYDGSTIPVEVSAQPQVCVSV